MFLMGQVIPFTAHLFRRYRLEKLSGRLLAISTMGSFMGSVIVTLVLMPQIQVPYTTVVVMALFLSVVVLLSRSKLDYAEGFLTIIIIATLNAPVVLSLLSLQYSNQYNSVQLILREDGARILSLNGNYSAGYHDETGVTAPYVRFINKTFIAALTEKKASPKDILIVGAGGFTMGVDDHYNHYTYVDIDPDLKNIVEEKFLRQKLSKNKKFVIMPVRRFFGDTDQKFDLIVLDAFYGQGHVPEQLVTKEFFEQVLYALRSRGKIVINAIACPNFNNAFSRHLDNTLYQVFHPINRFVPNLDGVIWSDVLKEGQLCERNVLYEYTKPDLH
jgi:spermidine synthase